MHVRLTLLRQRNCQTNWRRVKKKKILKTEQEPLELGVCALTERLLVIFGVYVTKKKNSFASRIYLIYFIYICRCWRQTTIYSEKYFNSFLHLGEFKHEQCQRRPNQTKFHFYSAVGFGLEIIEVFGVVAVVNGPTKFWLDEKTRNSAKHCHLYCLFFARKKKKRKENLNWRWRRLPQTRALNNSKIKHINASSWTLM